MSLLMSSMIDTGRKAMCETFGMQKPRWLSQTERFESFFSQLSQDEAGLDNFKCKFLVPFFKTYGLDLTCSIINSEDVIQDDYIKVKNTDTLSLKTTPNGLFLHNADGQALRSLYLPISDGYTSAVEIAMKDKHKSVDLPVKILLGLYGVLYHGLEGNEHVSQTELGGLKSNITVLQDYMEEISADNEAPAQNLPKNDPMGMIKNLLGNVNFDQIGQMMEKVTNDKEASNEFKEVFGKMTEGIQGGKAPLDVMTEIIKDATSAPEEPAEPTAPTTEPPAALEAVSEETTPSPETEPASQ